MLSLISTPLTGAWPLAGVRKNPSLHSASFSRACLARIEMGNGDQRPYTRVHSDTGGASSA